VKEKEKRWEAPGKGNWQKKTIGEQGEPEVLENGPREGDVQRKRSQRERIPEKQSDRVWDKMEEFPESRTIVEEKGFCRG